MTDRRSFLMSGAAGLLTAAAGAASAGTILKGDEKMMPADTRNTRGGWKAPERKIVQIKNCRIGEGAPKIIASTTARSVPAFLQQMKEYAQMPELDVIEWRVDFLGELTGREFADISRDAYKLAGEKPVLLTFRDKLDGGARHVDDDWYGEFYAEIIKRGSFDWIDFEEFRDKEMEKELVKKAKAKKKVVMFSDHEFGWTPSEDEMIRRLLLQDAMGSDILKLAVMEHDTGDALRLMSATWKVKNYFCGKPLLTMAMGRWGVLTRACGEFTGSDLTFAMVGGVPSAPGQIPYKDAYQTMQVLHKAMYPQGA